MILHVVAPGAFGGLERVVQLLGGGLRGLGHEVHVAGVVGDPHDGTSQAFFAPLASAGVHTHAVPSPSYLAERAGVERLCRDLRPVVVHTHGYRPDVLDAGVARRLRVPVVTTVHGFTGGGWKNRIYEWLQCRAFRRFAAVVAVSRPLAARLRRSGVPAGRIHEVPNAFGEVTGRLDRKEARRLLRLPQEGLVVGWVGRFSHEKGADVLLDAIPHLQDLPLTVSMIGDGAEGASLAARGQSLGLNGRVRWHGPVTEAGRLFAAFDVFVLSSRTEGTPIVLFEAMAAGVPIVATAVGGVPDVVTPAEAALVPSERPIELAAEIRAIHAAPDVAAARAGAAKVRLERTFGIGPWLERYQSIYRSVA